MKRVGGLWDDFRSFSNATGAINDGTEHKRGDFLVRRRVGYEDDDPKHIGALCPTKVKKQARLLIELVSSDWKPSPMKPKVIRPPRGKERNIMCPVLTDHFIHWMLIRTIKPCLMRGMYAHSYGSIPNRGIDGARATVERWIQHDPEAKYFVKLDIRKFYENIKQDILKSQFRHIIKDEKILTIIDKTIEAIPCGVPIGAYSSQWFANFYLQSLDHFIVQGLYKTRRGKQINFVKHYLRYMDDLLLIGSSKRDLEKAIRAVMQYCHDKLQIEIKPCWEIKLIAARKVDEQGKKINLPHVGPIDICGYRFYKDHTEIRSGIFLHASRLAAKIEKRLARDGTILLLHAQGLNSLCGWFSHGDSEYFLANYVNNRVNINFLKEVISYADKNGIVGDAARIYCRKRERDGRYQILYGCSGGSTRSRHCVSGYNVVDELPVDFFCAGED